jgi:hypothetical protein
MDINSVRECILSLKLKNSEGFDRISQLVLIDGVDHLIKPIAVLMDKIYNNKKYPTNGLCLKLYPSSRIRATLRTSKIPDPSQTCTQHQKSLKN